VAWLIRVNRIHGGDEKLANARTFAAAFRGGSWNGRASVSQISRWETACVRAGSRVLLRAAMEATVDGGDMIRYSELNAELHHRLRMIARHATATRIIQQLNAQVVRHQFRLSLIAGRSAVSLQENVAIIDAVCARDPKRAERLCVST
jgi:DNA-binding GntR family transcriptional regulator